MPKWMTCKLTERIVPGRGMVYNNRWRNLGTGLYRRSLSAWTGLKGMVGKVRCLIYMVHLLALLAWDRGREEGATCTLVGLEEIEGR